MVRDNINTPYQTTPSRSRESPLPRQSDSTGIEIRFNHLRTEIVFVLSIHSVGIVTTGSGVVSDEVDC